MNSAVSSEELGLYDQAYVLLPPHIEKQNY